MAGFETISGVALAPRRHEKCSSLSVRGFKAKPLEVAQNSREDWPACHSGPPTPPLLLLSAARPSPPTAPALRPSLLPSPVLLSPPHSQFLQCWAIIKAAPSALISSC